MDNSVATAAASTTRADAVCAIENHAAKGVARIVAIASAVFAAAGFALCITDYGNSGKLTYFGLGLLAPSLLICLITVCRLMVSVRPGSGRQVSYQEAVTLLEQPPLPPTD